MTLHNSFWQTFYWDSKIEQFMITQTYRHNIYSSSRHSVKGHFYYRMKSNFIPTWLSNFFYYTQCSNTPKNNHLSSSTQSTGALQNTLTEIAKFNYLIKVLYLTQIMRNFWTIPFRHLTGFDYFTMQIFDIALMFWHWFLYLV